MTTRALTDAEAHDLVTQAHDPDTAGCVALHHLSADGAWRYSIAVYSFQAAEPARDWHSWIMLHGPRRSRQFGGIMAAPSRMGAMFATLRLLTRITDADLQQTR